MRLHMINCPLSSSEFGLDVLFDGSSSRRLAQRLFKSLLRLFMHLRQRLQLLFSLLTTRGRRIQLLLKALLLLIEFGLCSAQLSVA